MPDAFDRCLSIVTIDEESVTSRRLVKNGINFDRFH